MDVIVIDDNRVAVLFGERGPYLVLDSDGNVTEQFTAIGDDYTTTGDVEGARSEGYDNGLEDGHKEGVREGRKRGKELALKAAARALAPHGKNVVDALGDLATPPSKKVAAKVVADWAGGISA